MYIAYTDGERSSPGEPGGASCIIVHDEKVRKYNEGYISTNDSRMKLRAVILALTHVPVGEQAVVYSKSLNVTVCAAQKGIRSKNSDLWDLIDSYSSNRKVYYWRMRGHTEYSDMCADLCAEAMDYPERKDIGYIPNIENDQPISNDTYAMSVRIPQDSHRNIYTSPEMYRKVYSVNLECAWSIQRFFRSQKEFADYRKLRTGGLDCWSKKKISSMADHDKIEEICQELRIGEKPTASAVRWHARGLSIHDAIRKALVDLEVADNVINSRW